MKKLFNVILIFLIFMLTTGYSNHSAYAKGEYKKSIIYSNLADPSSQKEVRQTMESAKIPSKNINFFFKNVNHYNNTIKKKSLTKNGFVTSKSLEPEYDVIAIQKAWNASNPIFIGYNCRITAFGLINPFISIKNTNTKNSTNLFMDEDAINNSPEKPFNKVEQNKFKSLFSYIPTKNVKDINFHIKKVQEDWKRKGIAFSNKNNISLISVIFHDYEDKHLFIGHAGVLIQMKNGKLLFIEKISFLEPYQALKFNNRTELNYYLMKKYDVEFNQPSARPFIMENDKLLKGYGAI